MMSNETKWTEGPWVVGVSQDDDDMHCVDTAYHYANGQVNEVCKVFGTDEEHVETDESRANARLIAAAPELYEAVRRAEQLAQIASDWSLDEVEIDGEMVSTYEVAGQFNAALAKARGETS